MEWSKGKGNSLYSGYNTLNSNNLWDVGVRMDFFKITEGRAAKLWQKLHSYIITDIICIYNCFIDSTYFLVFAWYHYLFKFCPQNCQVSLQAFSTFIIVVEGLKTVAAGYKNGLLEIVWDYLIVVWDVTKDKIASVFDCLLFWLNAKAFCHWLYCFYLILISSSAA